MKRRAGFLALLALFALALALLAERPTPSASVRSRAPRGLRAAFHYLERRGVDVRAWERPLARLPEQPGLLIVAMPLAAPPLREDLEALDRWSQRGGNTLLLADPSGAGAYDAALLAAFGLSRVDSQAEPPLGWSGWRRWRTAESVLVPAPWRVAAGRTARPVVLTGAARIGEPPSTEAWLLDANGTAFAFEVPRQRGRLVVVNNATLLANAWLARDGNLAWLEETLGDLVPTGGAALFDEWHQGYREVSEEDGPGTGVPLALLLTHLGLIYCGVVFVLARPFGPRLVAEGANPGSISRSLLGLASLHRVGRHAAEAGQLLLDHARPLVPQEQGDDPLPERFEGGEAEFLALARTVGERQRRRNHPPPFRESPR